MLVLVPSVALTGMRSATAPGGTLFWRGYAPDLIKAALKRE